MNKAILLICILLSLFIATDNNLYLPYKAPKIVLITLDGTRWQDIFGKPSSLVAHLSIPNERLIPTIRTRFIDGGVAFGEKSAITVANPAHVSLPGYIEIMSGRPSKTCFDNQCGQNDMPTIIDKFPNDAAVFASWELINKTFDNSFVIVNTGPLGRNDKWDNLLVPDNKRTPDEFGDDEYRADKYTQEAVMQFLYFKDQPSFMWVSLGDTDEYAHQNNSLFYYASLNSMDTFIYELMKITDPNTIFIICPDHGRSVRFTDHGSDASSGRVYILLGGNIEKQGSVKLNYEAHLSDIYPTIIRLTKNRSTPRSLIQ